MTAQTAAPAGLDHRSLRRRLPPLTVIAAGLVLLTMAVAALWPALFASAQPEQINPAATLLSPSADHVLGTDGLGRDMWSRVVHGTASALAGPLILATTTVAISLVLALVAVYYGGWVDAVISRTVDVLYSIPPLIIAIVVVGVLNGGYVLALVVLVVFNIPNNVRLLRAGGLEQRHAAYVEAAETLGLSPFRVMFWHLLPVLRPLVAAAFFLRFTYGLVDLSSLSFLGLGVPPGAADWGRMLAENRVSIFDNAWTALAPGLALVVVGASMNTFGDWLYERLEARGAAR